MSGDQEGNGGLDPGVIEISLTGDDLDERLSHLMRDTPGAEVLEVTLSDQPSPGRLVQVSDFADAHDMVLRLRKPAD
jgi:hypothetical protein